MRLVAATAGLGGTMPPPVTPDPQPGLGWVAAGVMALFGSGGLFVAWVNRKAGLDKLVETRLSQYVETLNRDLDGLRERNRQLQDDVQELQARCLGNEEKIFELSRSLDTTTRENDQLKAENSRLKSLDEERIAQLATAQHLLLEREALINERKAENAALVMQVQLLLGQVSRFSERLLASRQVKALEAVQGKGRLTVSGDGTIIECDRGAMELFGGPLKGLSVLETIPPRFYGGHIKGFGEALASGQVPVHPRQTTFLRVDGSELAVELTLEAVRAAGPEGELRFRAHLKTLD